MLGPKTNHEPQDYLLLALASPDTFYIHRFTKLSLELISRHAEKELYKEASFLPFTKEQIAQVYKEHVLGHKQAHLFHLLKEPFEPNIYSVLRYLAT